MAVNRKGHNLTQAVVQDLGVAIVTGKYDNTERFPTEAELCEHYQVSRSIMREATKMLTAKGLLSARPRIGTTVLKESDWNVLDTEVLEWYLQRKLSLPLLLEFAQVRQSIEPTAAELAAHYQDSDDIACLHAALARMDAATRGDDDPLEADIAFHLALLDASKNRFFTQLKSLSATALKFSIRLTNLRKGVTVADLDAHRAIVDAIDAGQADVARHKTCLMLDEVIALIGEIMAEQSSLTSSR